MQNSYSVMEENDMGVNGKSKYTIPKGTLIRCTGDLKHKTIFSDSYSHSVVSVKGLQSLALIEGDLIAYKADNSFILHGGVTKDLVDFQVITTAQKSLCITILLEGKLDFGYDNLNFFLDASLNKRAVIVNLARPVSFRRTLYKNNNVSKLNIILPFNWVESRIRGNDNLSTFVTKHLANFEISLNADMLDLSFDILNLSSPSDFMQQMQLEVLTQRLLLTVFLQIDSSILSSVSASGFSSEEQIKSSDLMEDNSFDPVLDKLISYIESNLDIEMSVAHLADFSAMSTSSLQHKFKQVLGTSIRSYIRRRRLFIAKQQLELGLVTISKAAYNAGYRHPSNFTSAFKKTFGLPPQDIAIKGSK